MSLDLFFAYKIYHLNRHRIVFDFNGTSGILFGEIGEYPYFIRALLDFRREFVFVFYGLLYRKLYF